MLAKEEALLLSPQHKKTPKSIKSPKSPSSSREVNSPSDGMLHSEGPEAGDGDDDASVGSHGSHGSFTSVTSETSYSTGTGTGTAMGSLVDRSQTGTAYDFDTLAEEGEEATMAEMESSAGGSSLPGEVKLLVPMPYLKKEVLHRKLQAEIQMEKEEEAKRAAKAAKTKDNPLSKESRKAKKDALKRRKRGTRGSGRSPKNKN